MTEDDRSKTDVQTERAFGMVILCWSVRTSVSLSCLFQQLAIFKMKSVTPCAECKTTCWNVS